MNPKVDWFFNKEGKWQEAFKKMRSIALATGLAEELKMLVISCVFTVLVFALLLPIFGFYKMKGMLSTLFVLLAVFFFIKAHC